jgi:apolipoprotein N-acyltransferase
MNIQKIIGLCILSAMLFFVFYNISNYFNFATSISSTGLFILCIFYFYQLLNSSLNLKLFRDPSFIICCGIFIGSGILIISSWIHKYFQINKIDVNLEFSFAALSTVAYLILYISIVTAFLRLPSKN